VCRTSGFAPMLALAIVTGIGGALFGPASGALLPALVSGDRLPAANGLYRVLRDSGVMAGPALAAGLLLFTGPTTLLLVDAASFAASALLLARLRRGPAVTAPPEPDGDDNSLLAETRDGLRAIARLPAVPLLLGVSAAAFFCSGLMSVGELLLARDELGGGAVGYPLLVAAFGIGQVGGGLIGAGAGDDAAVMRRLAAALGLLGSGLALSGVAPHIAVAAATFLLTGTGDAIMLVCTSLLLQRLTPERLHGRVFGVLDSMTAWGFGAALLASGAIAATLGARPLFLLAGIGVLAVAAAWRLASARGTPGVLLLPLEAGAEA
jgi:MFS family permease